MLPDPREVDEPQVDDLDIGIFREFFHVFGRLRHDVPLLLRRRYRNRAKRRRAGTTLVS